MTKREKDLFYKLYELQVELFTHQGEEITALRKGQEALWRSHEVLGSMLKLTADLLRMNRGPEPSFSDVGGQ